MRVAAGLAIGVLVSAFGALVAGEYPLDGLNGVAAGVIIGLIVGEAVLAIGRDRRLGPALAAAVAAGGGVAWGAWLSSGSGVAPVPAEAWVGVALAAAVAGLWVRAAPSTERDSPPVP